MSLRRLLQHSPILLLVSMLFEWTCIRFDPLRCLVLGMPFDPRVLALLLPLGVFAVVVLTFRHGRVFCSWCCPSHLYFEGLRWIARVGGRWVRLLQWGAALLVSAFVTQALVTCFVSLPDQRAAFQSEGFASRLFMAEAIIFVTTFLNMGLVRWRFCLHACPYGLLMRLFKTDQTEVTLFDAASGRCTNCVACDRVCPYELNVRKQSAGDLCTNCGLCIAACRTVLGAERGVLRSGKITTPAP